MAPKLTELETELTEMLAFAMEYMAPADILKIMAGLCEDRADVLWGPKRLTGDVNHARRLECAAKLLHKAAVAVTACFKRS